MSEYSKIRDVETEKIITGLFSTCCVVRSEIRQQMTTVDKVSARRIVVDQLSAPGVTKARGPLILAILEEIGVGEERLRLMALALDDQRPPRVRMWAAMALSGRDPDMMALLINDLEPAGITDIAEDAVAELMTIQRPDRIGATVARAFREWHRTTGIERLLDRIESCRMALGISCTEAYKEALTSKPLTSIWPKLLEYFIQEGSEEGIELLETRRNETRSEEERRRLQSALLRLRSTRIAPGMQRTKIEGYSLVSNCDGQGGILVLGIFENRDGTFSLSELYLRVGGGIVEGIVHGRIGRDSVAHIIQHHELDTNCAFAKTSLEASAALVVAAADRHEEKKEGVSKSELRQAVMLFRRVEPASSDEIIQGLSAKELSLDDIRALLKRPEYKRAWIFDLEDLKRFGFSTVWTAEEKTGEETLAPSRLHLDIQRTEPLRRRLTTMAKHMARWHCWRGETAEAGLCIALARDVAEDLNESRLLQAIWERSREWLDR
jgi:hypothetical protein